MVFNYRRDERGEMRNFRNLSAVLPFAALPFGAAAAVSFAAAAAAVLLPQAAMLFFARRKSFAPQSAFSLWAGKFSCTILLLALGARLLHSGGMIAAEFFVAGAAAALLFNVAHLVRSARKTEAA